MWCGVQGSLFPRRVSVCAFSCVCIIKYNAPRPPLADVKGGLPSPRVGHQCRQRFAAPETRRATQKSERDCQVAGGEPRGELGGRLHSSKEARTEGDQGHAVIRGAYCTFFLRRRFFFTSRARPFIYFVCLLYVSVFLCFVVWRFIYVAVGRVEVLYFVVVSDFLLLC